MTGWATWPLYSDRTGHRSVLKVKDLREERHMCSNCFNKILGRVEISLLKYSNFVGGVEGEVGQTLVPECQEATFHGNYLP